MRSHPFVVSACAAAIAVTAAALSACASTAADLPQDDATAPNAWVVVMFENRDAEFDGSLMDALLPALYFGQPIVGYRGRFEPERAFRLIERYQIRNTFLFPTALKLMMKAYPRPREHFDIDLRSVMSAGEAVGTTVSRWAQRKIGTPSAAGSRRA